jgi:hypothetical protein
MFRACVKTIFYVLLAGWWGWEPTVAQSVRNSQPSAWQVKKCQIYHHAWSRLLEEWGHKRFSAEFVDKNRIFIENACLIDVDVCPNSPMEIEAANVLTIATMNAGAASSFSPFRCRKPSLSP